MEQRKIIQNATRRNRLKSGGNDVNETIEAEGNLQDVIELLANLRKNKEPLLHSKTVPAGVRDFIDMKSGTVSSSAVPKARKPKLPKTEYTEVSEVSVNESH